VGVKARRTWEASEAAGAFSTWKDSNDML